MLSDFPFSLPVNVRTLSKKGSHEKFVAEPDQRAAIAERYDLISVESFKAEAHVTPWRKGGVRVVGQIDADYTQPCAISGQPLTQTLTEEVDALFVPAGSRLARPKTDGEGEVIVDVEGDDLPEVFEGDTIDLAQVWLEFFALGLDPFAHIEGAKIPDRFIATDEDDEEENSAAESPFAALSALKKD